MKSTMRLACKIGRASCRERVWSWGGAVPLKKQVAHVLLRARLKENFVLALHVATFRSQLNTEFSAYLGGNNQLTFSRNVCSLQKNFLFFSSRRRHTRCSRDWSSDVCSSDLPASEGPAA